MLYGIYSCIYGVQTAVDEERAAFMRLAGDDGEIDAYELQDILNQEFKKREMFINFSLCHWSSVFFIFFGIFFSS